MRENEEKREKERSSLYLSIKLCNRSDWVTGPIELYPLFLSLSFCAKVKPCVSPGTRRHIYSVTFCILAGVRNIHHIFFSLIVTALTRVQSELPCILPRCYCICFFFLSSFSSFSCCCCSSSSSSYLSVSLCLAATNSLESSESLKRTIHYRLFSVSFLVPCVPCFQANTLNARVKLHFICAWERQKATDKRVTCKGEKRTEPARTYRSEREYKMHMTNSSELFFLTHH